VKGRGVGGLPKFLCVQIIGKPRLAHHESDPALRFVGLVISRPRQNAPGTDSTKVMVTRLSEPQYPRMALFARIAGVVRLEVTVRANGSVDSVKSVSGPPMLIKSAVDSAQQTEFECKDCKDGVTQYMMTYRFELGDTLYCTGIDAGGNTQFEPYQPHVTESQGTVTIVDRPSAICDPSTSITFTKVRSAKCLFLWRCSKRYPL
jgi:TonB family protein